MSIFDYGKGKFQEICIKGMFLISMFPFIFATRIFVFKSSNTRGGRNKNFGKITSWKEHAHF